MGENQYPYLILVNSLIPALLAGNSVILKPSPQTPTIVEHVQDLFAEAGLPDKVIQYFHCGSLTLLESIVRSPQIRLICFTGSVAGGLQVQRAASDRVVSVGLELGGKDPAYVREDVDVRWAAEEIVDGAVFNSGQSCCSIERVYVAEKVHDAFVSAVQDVLKGYKLGDPFDQSTNVGPVVSKKSADTIKAHIEDAIDKGAKDSTPGNQSFTSPPADGNYIRPTLLTNVTHDMVRTARSKFYLSGGSNWDHIPSFGSRVWGLISCFGGQMSSLLSRFAFLLRRNAMLRPLSDIPGLYTCLFPLLLA